MYTLGRTQQKFELVNMQYYSINSYSFQAFWNYFKTIFIVFLRNKCMNLYLNWRRFNV